MKSQKGITLISLTIYVIVMAVVIGVLAILTTFFFKNMKEVGIDLDPITEYTTFNSYFSEEVNHANLKILECKENYIVFNNGIQYSYIPENKGIYQNQVKICSNVDQCNFSYSIKNGKYVIEVQFKAGKQNRTTTYTLKE